MASETEDNALRDVSRRSVFKQVGAAGAAALAGAFAPSAAVAQERAAQRNPVTAAPLEALETLSLDFSNISVHRGRESEKDVVLQQFL
jgi:hypothetical protein